LDLLYLFPFTKLTECKCHNTTFQKTLEAPFIGVAPTKKVWVRHLDVGLKDLKKKGSSAIEKKKNIFRA
jgi:hypothetical protein